MICNYIACVYNNKIHVEKYELRRIGVCTSENNVVERVRSDTLLNYRVPTPLWPINRMIISNIIKSPKLQIKTLLFWAPDNYII